MLPFAFDNMSYQPNQPALPFDPLVDPLNHGCGDRGPRSTFAPKCPLSLNYEDNRVVFLPISLRTHALNQSTLQSGPENPDYLQDEDSGLGFSPWSDFSDEQTSDSNGLSVPVQPVTSIATESNENNSSNETTVTETGTQPTPLRGKTSTETRINFIHLRCSECSLDIPGNLDSLYKHKQVEHGLKPYACLQRGCNARVDLYAQMSPHRQKEHKDVREFCCKLCDKKYSKYGGLKQHDKNNHLKGLFECNVDRCGLETRTLGKMESHISTHDKKFICLICKTGFITKEKLKGHEPLHANESNQSIQTQP